MRLKDFVARDRQAGPTWDALIFKCPKCGLRLAAPVHSFRAITGDELAGLACRIKCGRCDNEKTKNAAR